MRIVIRVISAYFGLVFLNAAAFFVANVSCGKPGGIFRSGLEGGLVAAFLLLQMLLAPYATVLLWRYAEKGRRAGLLLFSAALMFYGAGFFLFPYSPGDARPVVIAACLYAGVIVLLMLPGANAVFHPDQRRAEEISL